MSLTIPMLNALCAERQAQDAQWGGREHDATHTIEEWQQYLHDHTARLTSDPDPKQRLIKIAALALAAAEVQSTLYAACWGDHVVIERTHDYAIRKLIDDVLTKHADGWRTPQELRGDEGSETSRAPKVYEVALHLATVSGHDDDGEAIYEPGLLICDQTIVMTYNEWAKAWEAGQ